MRYICYISKDRVDDLFVQAFDSLVDAREKTVGQERTKGANFGVSAVLELLKIGLTFGRKDSSTTKETSKVSTITRLKDVLRYLQEKENPTDIAVALANNEYKIKWYLFSSRLAAKGWTKEGESVDLIGKIYDWQLELSCATQNFSSLGREREKTIPSSTNRFLFEKQLALPMAGVLLPVHFDAENKKIIASPLFLIMNPEQEDLGDLNDVAL